MKHLALILALTAAIPAHAGGPVLIEEEYTVAEPQRVNPLVIVGGLLLIGALVSGGGDDDAPAPPVKPGPACFDQGGC